MRNIDFFILGNSIVCINFTNNVIADLEKVKKENIKIIHIFVFDESKIKRKSLIAIANACKRSKIKVILHIYSNQDKILIKNDIKGNCIFDKNFHFHLEKRPFEIKFNNNKKIRIEFNKIQILDGESIDLIFNN